MRCSSLLAVALVLAIHVSARAATTPACTRSWLSANAPANTTINSATLATMGTTQYCQVEASMLTDASLNDVVHYELDLPGPSAWNHRLEFDGNAGFAGSIHANRGAVQAGWAVASTDTGHQAPSTSASWALNNLPAVQDFAYRALHNSTLSAQALIDQYYGMPYHSYFLGCSLGGRQGLVEAQLYPQDFDGIVAGDPAIGEIALGAAWNEQSILAGQSSYLDPAALALVDQAVKNECGDPAGPAEGLILNPPACGFRVSSLQCRSGNTGCLSTGQVTSFDAIFSGIHDTSGNSLYPGYSVSDVGYLNSAGQHPEASWADWITGCSKAALTGTTCPLPSFVPTAAEPWSQTNISPPMLWIFMDQGLKYIVYNNPNFNSRTLNLSDQTVLDQVTTSAKRWGGDGTNPHLVQFVGLNHKLLMYHGWSDPALTPYISVRYYKQVAGLLGTATTNNVRLFMVPGMEHCAGGPGPNVFDTRSALVNWVEREAAPDGIVAKHYTNNNRSNPIDRTIPLCKYPELPTYIGPPGGANNAYNVAANWACK
jgi:feruloyl esterase